MVRIVITVIFLILKPILGLVGTILGSIFGFMTGFLAAQIMNLVEFTVNSIADLIKMIFSKKNSSTQEV